ncbi:hypothetical protein GCM10027194_20660 [Thalassiella azotivora]
MSAPSRGRVVLVGGGPGAADLLTVRAVRALQSADVVVTDRLGPVDALAELCPGTEVVDVAKVPRGPATPQEAINELLVRRALAGEVVVRLKGGDPFVFGRGMEEVLACRAAGVPVEVVPGVTSAVAAPSAAGVPVTHRGLAQGFSVVSGHLPPGHPGSTVDWAALARSGTTLVLLMAVENLAAICAALQAAGMPGCTPVACVQDAGSGAQRTLTTDLAGVASVAAGAGLRPPAVTVVGDVAAFAATHPLLAAAGSAR